MVIDSLSYGITSLTNIDRFGIQFARYSIDYIGCTTCKLTPNKIFVIVVTFDIIAGVEMAAKFACWEVARRSAINRGKRREGVLGQYSLKITRLFVGNQRRLVKDVVQILVYCTVFVVYR